MYFIFKFSYSIYHTFIIDDLLINLKLVKTDEEFRCAFEIFAAMYLDRNDFDDYARRWKNPQTHIYLIDKDNEICGYVLITSRNEIGYMVSTKFQGKGIGKNAIKQLMEIEPREYYWVTIPKENEHSMGFLQSIGGFVPRGYIYGYDPPKK